MSRDTRCGGSRSRLGRDVGLATVLLLGAGWPGAAAQPRAASPADAVTFSKDIAPIVFEHCVTCHRPDSVAPMSLRSYQEVRPWARAIREQVTARQMPPWKPEPGYGDAFVGNRRLSDRQIALIAQWVAEGAPEGNPADVPPLPARPAGWRLGQPDLVIEMPAPYTVAAGESDVFRKFAIPIPTSESRYVRGVEFLPGNARVVHHANMRIDATPASRQLDAADPAPGYDGVTPFAALFPQGYFLGWTPGQLRPLEDRMAWRLEPGSDMLLELHLMQGEQSEVVQSRIGFFFTDDVPRQAPTMIRLGRQNLDIAAGATDYVSRDRYVLPVDVEVHGVQPHAHNLAREIRGFAHAPERNQRRWLIYIRDWDFDWQDFYRYSEPFVLPKGTELTMEITYDNSIGNRRNPNAPPRRVTWGQGSSNEMGDLWIQVLPRNAADLEILGGDRRPQELAEDIVGYEMVLAAEPDQLIAQDDVALLYLQFGKLAEAAAHFGESARLAPRSPAAHYNLGTTLLRLGALDDAVPHLERALALDPAYVQAHNNLGAVRRAQGRPAEAVRHFRQAVLARPDDGEFLYNLAGALTLQGELGEAITYYRRATRARPDAPESFAELAWLLATYPDPRVSRPGSGRQPGGACRRADQPQPAGRARHAGRGLRGGGPIRPRGGDGGGRPRPGARRR